MRREEWRHGLSFHITPRRIRLRRARAAHDYQSNVEAYAHWQAWLRERRPPVLVAWGVHDPIFSVGGAQAIRREQPEAAVHLLDAGHFAINDRPRDIARLTHAFLADLPR